MKHFLITIVLTISVGGFCISQDKHSLSFDDLIAMGRVSDPQISSDGRMIAYTVTYYSKTENSSNSDIWVVPIDGGTPRQITASKKADFNARWSPDGRSIAFISSRDGLPQVWTISTEGGEARKITDVSTGASGVVWAPDGKYLAFISEVYPDCPSDSCNKAREETKEKSKVKARIYDHLLLRLWDSWTDEKRSHLLVVPAQGGEPWDITPGKFDVPPVDVNGSPDYAFSPDGKEVCFAMNTDSVIATSTNNDLFTVSIRGGKTTRITSNKASDNQPTYSPDGKYIAYRAMARPGFEADRYRLMLYERSTGRTISLTDHFDRSVGEFVWTLDGSRIIFTAEEAATLSIFSIPVKGGEIEKLYSAGYNGSICITPDGKTLVFTHERVNMPAEIFRLDIDSPNKPEKQLTSTNSERLLKLQMNPVEEFWFKGAGGEKVHGLLVKPAAFDPVKKYPMVYLIHGGPQGAWEDNFHYRWNAQMFASPGYIVVMVNFHGSTGYGQRFTDAISGDWGGKPYDDLMKGLDYVLENYRFIDKEKIAAAGASFGAYMINWIEGHTDRFKCLVSHDGSFNEISAYYATEELWFPEWDFKGTPWTNKALYEKFSPHNYIQNFKTPMLVVHGQLDYRIDVNEGIQMFTALQRMGVPSKFLYFPDEGHWVLKPQNSELWYKTVLEWLASYLK
jgi:dipeptidyl aminopeptidase/acylaminoacyl peptidase